jgi:arsenate reductase-like glutaredoxin family protein
MKLTKEEKLFIYNSTDLRDRELLALENANRNKLKSIDVAREKITPRQWLQICDTMDVRPVALLNKKVVEEQNLSGKSLSDEDLLKVMINQPEVLRTPILLSFRSRRFLSAYEPIKDDLHYNTVQSQTNKL